MSSKRLIAATKSFNVVPTTRHVFPGITLHSTIQTMHRISPYNRLCAAFSTISEYFLFQANEDYARLMMLHSELTSLLFDNFSCTCVDDPSACQLATWRCFVSAGGIATLLRLIRKSKSTAVRCLALRFGRLLWSASDLIGACQATLAVDEANHAQRQSVFKSFGSSKGEWFEWSTFEDLLQSPGLAPPKLVETIWKLMMDVPFSDHHLPSADQEAGSVYSVFNEDEDEEYPYIIHVDLIQPLMSVLLHSDSTTKVVYLKRLLKLVSIARNADLVLTLPTWPQSMLPILLDSTCEGDNGSESGKPAVAPATASAGNDEFPEQFRLAITLITKLFWRKLLSSETAAQRFTGNKETPEYPQTEGQTLEQVLLDTILMIRSVYGWDETTCSVVQVMLFSLLAVANSRVDSLVAPRTLYNLVNVFHVVDEFMFFMAVDSASNIGSLAEELSDSSESPLNLEKSSERLFSTANLSLHLNQDGTPQDMILAKIACDILANPTLISLFDRSVHLNMTKEDIDLGRYLDKERKFYGRAKAVFDQMVSENELSSPEKLVKELSKLAQDRRRMRKASGSAFCSPTKASEPRRLLRSFFFGFVEAVSPTNRDDARREVEKVRLLHSHRQTGSTSTNATATPDDPSSIASHHKHTRRSRRTQSSHFRKEFVISVLNSSQDDLNDLKSYKSKYDRNPMAKETAERMRRICGLSSTMEMRIAESDDEFPNSFHPTLASLRTRANSVLRRALTLKEMAESTSTTFSFRRDKADDHITCDYLWERILAEAADAEVALRSPVHVE